ncbi:hypothetical protein FRB99_006830 [Tulasnella sp. 403]|nr:hypothetical protein FRB99_006830 [Tulasnella sp. 403]
MFTAFRRQPHIHHPHSSSSHTGSSASGSVISGDSSSQGGSVFRSADGYDSDALRNNGWESDTRKSVRWNPSSKLAGRMVSSSSGYATDGPQRESGHSRSRTYSSSRSKLSSSSSSHVPGQAPVDEFQTTVDRLLRICSKPFAITGTIPLFAPISLFFQTMTGSCHLLRFPSEASIPSRTFDAFLAACEPVTCPPIPSRSQPSSTPPTHHTFRSSPSRPITPSFDIASHPILDTVRKTLFPYAQDSNYLVANLNRVDVFCPGASSFSPKTSYGADGGITEDEPCAHVIVTLPVRFRGGMMSVVKDGNEERFWGRGCLSAGSSPPTSGAFAALGQDAKKIAGSIGFVEWIAYTGRDCDARIDKVEKGVRINLVYDVWMKSYGPFGAVPRPLITPNDNILAALSSVLKRSRGTKLAFYMTNDYGISPSHVLAESIVPSLKGGDLALYHALKFYNLQPSLRYTAGGFIWPPTSYATIVPSPSFLEAIKRIGVKSAGQDEDLTIQIEEGGGVPLEREGIVVATGKEQGRIGKERVAFVEAGESKLECEYGFVVCLSFISSTPPGVLLMAMWLTCFPTLLDVGGSIADLHVNVCVVVYVH